MESATQITSRNGAELMVLGMHRSGTSLLTQVLQALGVHLGEPASLLPSSQWNEGGYGERRDVWMLNDWALRALDPAHAPWPPESGWMRAPFVYDFNLPPSSATHFAAHAGAIVDDLNRTPLWALKDPRLCVLLPLWRPFLRRPVIILNWRNPLEIALSLRARNGFPIAFGLALWEVYTRAALKHTRGLPRLTLSYDAFVANPQAAGTALLEALTALGVAGLTRSGLGSLSTVARGALRHQHVTPAACGESVNAAQLDLWHAVADRPLPEDWDGGDLSLGAQQAIAEFAEAMAREPPLLAEQAEETTRLRELRAAQTQALAEEAERLQGVVGQLDHGIQALLGSRSWKAGTALTRAAERILLRPAQPTPAQFLQSVLTQSATGTAGTTYVPAFRRPSRVVVLLTTDHDALRVAACLTHLATQGLLAYVMDRASTDGTLDIVDTFRDRVVVGVEHLGGREAVDPDHVLARQEQLAMELDADWFMRQSADEFRLPRGSRWTLCEWFGELSRAGFNAAKFFEFTFVPCREMPTHDHPDFQLTLRWYYPYAPDAPHNLQAWRRGQTAPSLRPHGGDPRCVAGLRPYPEFFLTKRYRCLGPAEAVRFGVTNLQFPPASTLRYSLTDQDLDPSNPRTRHAFPDAESSLATPAGER